METVKVSSKGQIVIPKALREARRIKTGTRLVISAVGDELRLAPVAAFPATSIRKVGGILQRADRKYLNEQQTRQAIGRRIAARDKAVRKR